MSLAICEVFIATCEILKGKIDGSNNAAEFVRVLACEPPGSNDPHFPLGYMIFHSVSGFLFSGSDQGFFMKVGKSITLLASGFFGTVRLFCFQLTKKLRFRLSMVPLRVFSSAVRYLKSLTILVIYDLLPVFFFRDFRSSAGVFSSHFRFYSFVL